MMKQFFVSALIFFSIAAYSQKESFKVKVAGKGDPIILIPDIGCSGDVWKQTVNDFKDHYQMYVLTLPGFDKVKPIDTPILKTVKDQLINYVKEKHLNKPVLIGHGVGGFLGLWIASEEPGLFSKIICADGFPFLPKIIAPSATLQQVQSNPDYDANALAGKYLAMTGNDFESNQSNLITGMVKNKEYARAITKWIMKSDRKTLAYTYAEMCTNDLRNAIATINIPVLVLASAHGTETDSKKITEDQFSLLPHKMVMIAPAKHFMMYDDPVWFREQVKNFLLNGLYN